MKNILVLGDSTGSALGGLSDHWLRKLHSTYYWNESIRFIDTCAPGVTAGAALITLLKKLITLRFRIFLVILSVGNCDRINRPYVANKTSIFKILAVLIKSIFGLKFRRKLDWVKLDDSVWQSNVPKQKNQQIENFEKTLKFIKFVTNFFKIKLIVIIPRSNLYFPPATAKPNSIFYELVNLRNCNNSEKEAGLPDLTDNFWLTNFNSSIKKVDVRESDLKVFELHETNKILCALNNFAVHLFDSKKPKESLICLEQLIHNSSSSSEIFSYNAAKIYWNLGDQLTANQFFEESLRNDTFSYRVDLSYSSTVKKIFKDSPTVKTLNLYDIKFDNLILDHCHLLPEGQILVMEEIKTHLLNFFSKGNYKSNLIFEPINPESGEGDLRNFNEVFGIQSSKDLDINLFKGRAHSIDSVPKQIHILSFRSKNIEMVESLVFYAFTYPTPSLLNSFIGETMNVERIRIENVVNQLNITLPKDNNLKFDPLLKSIWVDEILKNLHKELQKFIYEKINCGYRMRTIMNWYFKESLFFGFNSSFDMLYPRNNFRRWKEAICLGLALCEDSDSDRKNHFLKKFSVIKNLEEAMSHTYKNMDYLNIDKIEIAKIESDLELKLRSIWSSYFE